MDSEELPENKDPAPLQNRLAKLEEECQQLRQENERLRRMVQLREEPSSSPGPEKSLLFASPSSQPSVYSNSPMTERIALFWNLFRGREDVYPILWANERTGKKGYSPAVKGGWLGFQSKEREYLPLTAEVIQEHLTGKKTIGVYPLLKNDTCWFLACDFDGEDWSDDAVAYWATCQRYGVPAYLERSRSGNGGHIWIFFSMPVPAASARRLGASLMRQVLSARSGLDLASYDRFFPNQDYLPKGGFGNLIALPLQLKCRSLGNTEFLDPDNLQPWPDQWAFLSQIRRLSPEEVGGFLEKIPPVAVGLSSVVNVRRGFPLPWLASHGTDCLISAVLSVEKTGLPPPLLSDIKHLASLHNPVFYERQKLRLSTYRTPRFIKCYDQDLTHIHLPRGVLEELSALIEGNGGKLVVQDRRIVPRKISLSFTGELTSIQKEAVSSVLADDQGVLVAPPGSGKTVMGCYVAAQRSLPTLILVHRKPLLEQWRLQLMNLSGLSSKEIGQVGGGKDKRTGLIDLAMIQSLKKIEDAESFFSNYGLIIVDECHHIPAFSFESAVKRAPVRYILGLTATPYRRDGLQDIIMMQCGPIRHRVSPRPGMRGELTLELVNRETKFCFGINEEIPIQEVLRLLVHDSKRSQMICQDILDALRGRRRCLVMSQWKEHCRILEEQLAAQGRKSFVLDGSLRKKARNAIFQAIQQVPPHEDLLVITTGQYLGEGFDCPQLDTLFLAFPIAFRGRLVQYTGRLMRSFEGKQNGRVYDYADVGVPVLKRMQIKRLKTYKALGFEEIAEDKASA